MLGRLADAEASYRLAIKLAPNSPRGHYALGRLLMREGDKAEADRELAAHQAIYDRAQKLVFASQQQSGEATMARAELNEGKAAEALKRFQRLPPTPDALLGQAEALSRLQRHREAVAALEKAHQIDPDNKKIDLLLATERSRAEEP